MERWLHTVLVAVSSGIIVLILLLILRRCFKARTRARNGPELSDTERSQSLQNGIARLHQVSPHHLDHIDGPKTSSLFRRGPSTRPPFNWADHPSLVTDAVENGWSRFAFTALAPSPSVKSTRSILGACATGDPADDGDRVEIGWEVCEGSADFMQKIRLNPNAKKAINSSSSMAAVAVIRAGLPLPGPNLGNSSFPQEAYFEITILSGCGNSYVERKKGETEGDKIKLISEDFNAKNGTDSVIRVVSSHSQRKSKVDEGKAGKNDVVSVSVGLTGGSFLPLRIPGSYHGSIGFCSNGSVFLDGMKLAFESENDEWERTDKVIGCGYSPGQRRVFFTVDGQMVHEIHCRNEEFSSPLYPTLAANTDVAVLVNLGQSPFKFVPANLHRTPNPCFIGALGTSPALGNEDSRELFSMGRIDSQWLRRSAARSNNNTVNSIKSIEYDQESEGDLFEIVLDSSGRSPYTTIHQ